MGLPFIQSFRFLFIIIVCIYVYQRRQIPPEDGSTIRRKGRYSENEDYVAFEFGNPRVKQNENGLVRRRSAKEAANRWKRNFDVSSKEKEVVFG